MQPSRRELGTVTFPEIHVVESDVAASGEVETARDDADGPSPAHELERYTHQRLLGRGGMGAVHLVRDERIGREVALKQLGGGRRTHRIARARFAREMCLQGQLEHPAIVPVYDVGCTEDGDPFFTMKCVRGTSLAEVLHQQRTTTARVSRRKLLTAFSQLCAAVHYAHERGVVHRDIKPANIMLGAYGEVYLLDWGVAKLTEARDEEHEVRVHDLEQSGELDVVQTGYGVIMGSLSTMSPEQAVGGAVGTAADVYSLGAILFEILTLEPLHPRGTAEDVIAAIVRGVDARTSVRCPSADVPPELEALCVGATHLHPEDRIGSALAVRDALESYLDGDRDHELRRAAASRHAEAAARAAEEALCADSDDAHTRAGALREAGRALALDPENPAALGALVRLMTTPPRVPPREVEAESERLLAADIRTGAIAGSLVYGVILAAAAPTMWLVGCRDVRAYVVAHVLWGVAFVASLVAARLPTYKAVVVMYTAGLCATMYISTIFSPILVVPGVLTAHAAAFSTSTPKGIQRYVIGSAALACLGTIGAELAGLAGDTIRIQGGDLVLHSDVFAWTETAGLGYLAALLVLTVVVPALVVGKMACVAQDVSYRTLLQSWHLRLLVGGGPK